ncbi:hypothetical protein AbraIFM66951_007360 [Aspergillus brasiliensis]|uniref:Uncharacterized protein n=1 Tax=Aspergillus brasiliensis TaxID=319629 RepID=A0A9W5YMX5_9EURO|nr:hypothetical protein AbraCBS73388_005696 [Aspergillus brasiliensis]GKZ45000.1 hypothetical protein AbraIFM66951_007360 [Aspergillus brasiliensis]
MIRYKPTRIVLGDEDLRYHLERLLLRHSKMAEWHRQDLDRDSYSDDSVAFLGSEFFSPYSLFPRGSRCSSGPGSPSQGSWQSNQDREASLSELSALFNELDVSSCVVVQDEVRAMKTNCSSGVGGALSGTFSTRAHQEHRATESAHPLSRNTIDSGFPSSQQLGKRGHEWPHNHSLTRKPFATATMPPATIPVSLCWKDVGKGLSVPHRHSVSRPLILGARTVNRETLSGSTRLADSSLLLIDTSSEVENLRQAWSRTKVKDSGLRPSLNLEIRLGSTCVNLAAQETQSVDLLARSSSRTNVTLEVIKMPGANRPTRKTRGQRANLSLPGSAAVHHNGPGEGSGAEIGRAPAALPTRLQHSARPRSTETHRFNPIRRAPRNIASHATQTEHELVGLLPEQGHGGTITHQAVNSSLAAPAEGVQDNGYENNPPQEHMAREAAAISGLLRDMPPVAYFLRGHNANKMKVIVSKPSANPPLPGGRSMAAPHGHRSEPCIDTRASVNPRVMQARELEGYVNLMACEAHDNVEDGDQNIGSTVLNSTRDSQGGC